MENKDGIKFSLSVLPFGGYVAFHDPSDTLNYNQLSSEEKKYVLANRPALERSLVTLAGPFFNFVLAFVIFAFVGFFMPRESDVVSAKLLDSNQEKIYRVLSVNNIPLKMLKNLKLNFLKILDLRAVLKLTYLIMKIKENFQFLRMLIIFHSHKIKVPRLF